MKQIACIILFLFILSPLFGQPNMQLMNEFTALSNKYLKFDLFPDSTAMYTCNVEIVVGRGKKPPIVTSNNLSVFKMLKGIDSLLLNYDFKRLMGKHRIVKFILPVCIVISDSSEGQKSLAPHNAIDNITKFAYYNNLRDEPYPLIFCFLF